MKQDFIKYGLLFLVVALVNACAQINPLQGGAKDEYAPRIDSVGTYPQNGGINFTGNRITIKFDEYIGLNNPNDNIIITPQLANKPDISYKNKKLKIVLNDSLQKNTTYTISFNHAVTDITEKNDSIFQYVFSTGNYIDSLSLTGKVSDAFTNNGAEGYLVGLYSANSVHEFDSIPYNERPIYITQTDRTGNFKFNYLKTGVYTIFAVEDENRNLKLEPSERRAFILDKTVNIEAVNDKVELRAYQPEVVESKLVQTKFLYPGRLEFIFNNPPDAFKVSSELMELNQEDSGEKDSLIYWLERGVEGRMEFVVEVNGESDTLKPLLKNVPENGTLAILSLTHNLKGIDLLPDDFFTLQSSEPIDQVFSDRIHFLNKDSVELEQAKFKVENIRSLIFDTLDPTVALIKIDSAAVSSKLNKSVNTEVWISINQLEQDYFGSLILNIDTLFNQPTFIDLLNKDGEVVASMPVQQKMEFAKLIPGKYQIRLIFDDNNDGVWTTGSLKDSRLPERVIYNRELIDIKSKWEKEVDWVIEN